MSTPLPFERDRLTWLAYWMLGYGAFTIGLVGPLMPFLRADRQLSFTMGGVLTAVLALGNILSGLASNRALDRWGRRRMLWVAGAGAALAAIGVALARPVPLLLLGALLLGVFCSLLLTTVQATLADRHGERRGVAVAESNVVAALVTIMGPLSIGALQRTPVGWVGALYLPAGGLLLLAALYGRVRFTRAIGGERSDQTPRTPTRLPPAFWAFWAVVVLVVSIEWCLVVWGADYLESVVGLSKANASTAMGVFLLAVLLGRMGGSALARRYSGPALLLLALGVVAASFPLFWLPRWAPLNLLGLFVLGLGTACLFPFTLAVALGQAANQANAASARISLGVGVAILVAPLVLGWAADNLGLPTAFALVPALTVVAFSVTAALRRYAARRAAPQPV